MKHEFPKWMYHRALGGRIVETRDEMDALGAEWREESYPAHESEPEPAIEAEPEPEPEQQPEPKKARRKK